MFGDLVWPLNASRGLSAIAEFLWLLAVCGWAYRQRWPCYRLDGRPSVFVCIGMGRWARWVACRCCLWSCERCPAGSRAACNPRHYARYLLTGRSRMKRLPSAGQRRQRPRRPARSVLITDRALSVYFTWSPAAGVDCGLSPTAVDHPTRGEAAGRRGEKQRTGRNWTTTDERVP